MHDTVKNDARSSGPSQYFINGVRFEVFTAMTMKKGVFWDKSHPEDAILLH
jgi:hypothetical protein